MFYCVLALKNFLQMTQSVNVPEFLEEGTLQFDLRTPEVVDVTQSASSVRLTFELREMTNEVQVCRVDIYRCFVSLFMFFFF